MIFQGKSLDGALAAFSAVTRVQVLVSGELTQGVVSPGVSGNLGQREALGQLLGGTGLSAAFINADTVTLEKRVDTGGALEVGATTISALSSRGRPPKAPAPTPPVP